MQFGFLKKLSTVYAIKMVFETDASAIEGSRWMKGNIEYCAVVSLNVKKFNI